MSMSPMLRPNKRARETEDFSRQQKLQISLNYNIWQDEADRSASIPNPNPVSTGLRLSYDDDERNSSVTSASGSMTAAPSIILSLGDNFKTELDQQKEEFDQYIKIQVSLLISNNIAYRWICGLPLHHNCCCILTEEHLAMGLRDMKQRHVASFLAAIEKGVSKKLQEKDLEIDNMNRKNKELIERIKQVAMEAQNWHYRAKYNESVVNVLKSNLQQAISQGPDQGREGFGDSEVDDAASYIDPNNYLNVPGFLLFLAVYKIRFGESHRLSHLIKEIENCIRGGNGEMGSEGAKDVVIHVTGFKKFQGVAENPTETIVNNLKDYVEKRGLPAGLTLGSCPFLRLLEMQHPIVPGDGGISCTRETCCSIEAILKFLKKKGYENSVSVYESLPKTTMECCNSLMTSLLHCGIVDDIVQMFGLVVDNDEGIGLDEVFQQLPSPNIFCFTSISMDLPPMDDWEENVSTLEIFEAMIRKGLKSDKVTFLCVLTGCSHSGVEAQGRRVDTQHFSLVHAVAENMVYNNIGILEELESFEIDEENEVELFDTPSWTNDRGRKVLVNVDSFGAVGDGVSDDTQIDGTIVAPDEPNNWDPNLPRLWLDFSKLNGVLFQGNGVIDGSGSKWWASSCKKNKSNPCRGAPTALTIDSSSSVKVRGLTIQNSQQMHFVISKSASVRVSEVLVSAPEDSPNTDGIHITESTNVVLQDCKIGTGDDCISIVNGSSGIKMKRIYCGPGHGVSIGSLGKDNSTGIVTKVVLDTAFLKETTNGLRIKTWQGGNGYVRGIRFENVRMEDVENPIIIDQFYCDSPKACPNQTSAVKISEIMYRNVTGTTKSAKAMKFACSDTVPCSNIVVSNINLEKKDGTVETYCNAAQGFGYGIIHPSADCLTSQDKDYCGVGPTDIAEDYVTDQTEITELAESSSEAIVHTEL
ncbi:hypothetical protein GH714_027923 [Hevea brasiliensis]|uniref:endo-polygalacturonase n=1 Tax=Hevea brasiliensis TaxID=3981 RepID=A0A6A6KXJ6_HEVBR|nr:hypothetical protein GH714_027923 [Hevea brasiliensis]